MNAVIIKDYECDKCRFGVKQKEDRSKLRCNNKQSIYYYRDMSNKVATDGCEDIELKLGFK